MNDNNEPEPWTYVGTMPDGGILAEPPTDEKGLYAAIAELNEELTSAQMALAEQQDIDTALRQEIAALGEQMRTQSRRHVEDTSALRISHEERIQAIAASLHEAGERQGWCSTYDAILADAGLPARERDYEVYATVTVVLDLALTVTADGYDAARETVDEAMMRAALGLPGHLPEGEVTWEVTEVESVDD